MMQSYHPGSNRFGHNKNRLYGLIVLALFAGCTVPPPQPTVPIDYLQIATELRNAGDHLNASYYFEAALEENPGQEASLLRQLVEEQIRSGRLLAARSGLQRLREITSDDPGVEALQFALNHIVAYDDPHTKEMP